MDKLSSKSKEDTPEEHIDFDNITGDEYEKYLRRQGL